MTGAWPGGFGVWRMLRHRLDVFRVLFDRDLKVLYKRSALGFGWALGVPIVQLIVFANVFRRTLSEGIENYPVFIFSGVLVWGWFSSAVGEGVGLITANRALVGQPRFPLVTLPHVTVGVRLFHLAVAFPLLIGLLWWNGYRPSESWWALPVLVAVQYLFTVALVFPLAALNVVWPDVQHATRILLQLMMFMTPVFYRVEMVPPELWVWFQWNPLVGLLGEWRGVLIDGAWPDWGVLGRFAALACGIYLVGRWLFVRQSGRFLEEL